MIMPFITAVLFIAFHLIVHYHILTATVSMDAI